MSLFVSPGDDSMLIHCISGWDRTPLHLITQIVSVDLGGESTATPTFTHRKYLHCMKAVIDRL